MERGTLVEDRRLDTAMADVLARQPRLRALDTPSMRAHAVASKRAWNRGAASGLSARYETIEGPGAPMKVLRLATKTARETPMLVHIHGGGWSIGNLRTHRSVFASLALATGRTVWAPHPRQAPECPYPGPLVDTVSALRWVASRSPGGVFVSGDSAGANLALAAILLARDEGEPLPVLAASLHYGCYLAQFQSTAHRLFGDGFGLSSEKMRAFWRHYAPDGGDYADLNGCDFHDLPPIQIQYATCDPLADDSAWLHKRLADAGQRVEIHAWPGLAHGYLHYASDLADARTAFARTAQFFERHA